MGRYNRPYHRVKNLGIRILDYISILFIFIIKKSKLFLYEYKATSFANIEMKKKMENFNIFLEKNANKKHEEIFFRKKQCTHVYV